MILAGEKTMTPPNKTHTSYNLVRAATPDTITFSKPKLHAVTEEQLDALVKSEKPFQSGIALTMLGVVPTSLPGAWPCISAIFTGAAITSGPVAWTVIFVAALVGCVVCGANAIKGWTDSEKLLRELKGRASVALNQDQQTDDE